MNDEGSGLSASDKVLIGLAGTLGAPAIAAVAFSLHLNRRRPRI